MNTKNAKKTFLFNVFLASIAGEPLDISYTKLIDILGVSESTFSKLRHGRMNKMPAGLHPNLMASQFAANTIKEFPPACSTARRFAVYAQMLSEKYIFSDSLARFITMFSAGAAVIDEERANKFYTGMIPELIKLCYEEAYTNTEQDYQNRLMSRIRAKSELVYQKICDTINEDVLDSEKLNELLNVIYAASLRSQLPPFFSDLAYLEMLGGMIRSQANQPFYNFANRSEQISISDDLRKMVRTLCATEQVVAPSLNPIEFTLTQRLYQVKGLSTDEIAKHAFRNLSITVNNFPVVKYINLHEDSRYTSPLQFVTVIESTKEVGGMTATWLVLRFKLYPAELGEPINVEYEYSCASPFIHDISSVYSYTLQYPCKSLEHEFRLDEQTRRKWGIGVQVFTLLTKSTQNVEKKESFLEENGDSEGSKRVVIYDWALPGAGYYVNLYELRHTRSRSEPALY